MLQLGKISDEDERGLEGKMVMLKTTKRILKIPKSGQNLTDSPKEVPNIPTLHITYRNHEKFTSFNRNIPYFYPLRNIENTSSNFKLKNDSFITRKILHQTCEDSSNELLYIYGQTTLHYVLQTYFGFYDTEFILHKCVDYKNYQAASKISFLDGHFSDSLGFQLSCFKLHMDSIRWRPALAVKHVDTSTVTVQSAVKSDKLVSNISKNVNAVSVISTSCSLESIKQFNDDLYSQGGFEEMCGEELSFLGQKSSSFREISLENLNTAAQNEQTHSKGSLKSELIDKLEFKSKVRCENLVLNTDEIISDGYSNTNSVVYDAMTSFSDPSVAENVVENDSSDIGTSSIEFSTDVIRKTVVNYVESLDADIINNDRSTIPNLNHIYKDTNSLQSEFERLCPTTVESETSDCKETCSELNSCADTNDIIECASKIIEYYCSRPQILENHILMQNILIKSMQFWLTNNLPVEVLERILLKNMDKYFYPLSILLFCKNFNNNLGEGMVKDNETKKSQKSFEFLQQLSTKFCLQLCSMVLQNVNKS